MNTDTIRDLYHAYYYDAQTLGEDDPMSFDEWYAQSFLPFLSGRELVLNAVN